MNPSSCNRTLVPWSLLIAAVALMGITAFASAAQTARWRRYYDPRTGLSFRYPADLHVTLRDPGKFGLPKVETIVDLIGNTELNPGTVVLRFLVRGGRPSAGERARRKELHRGCVSASPIVIDGKKALVCVTKGRAAVHWSVEISKPRECTILTLLGGADADQAMPPPHDGEFPLLSIIRTVRFTPISGRSGH